MLVHRSLLDIAVLGADELAAERPTTDDAAGEPLELVPQGLDDCRSVATVFTGRSLIQTRTLTERLRATVFFKPSAEVAVPGGPHARSHSRSSTEDSVWSARTKSEFRFDPVTEPFVVRFTARSVDDQRGHR